MIQRELILTKEAFFQFLPDLIKSGVTFESEEKDNGNIIIYFTGGY